MAFRSKQQSKEQLIALLQSKLSSGAYNKLNNEKPMEERTPAELEQIVLERVVRLQVVDNWNLWISLTQADEIKATVAQEHPKATLKFISWLTTDFVTRPQSSEPVTAGIRTAILGTLWTILFTILFAFPIGTGAAIYLEEYATDTWLNRIIQTNINNLAGVPSIVYGMLGLAIFVRNIEPITSGAIFGYTSNLQQTDAPFSPPAFAWACLCFRSLLSTPRRRFAPCRVRFATQVSA